MLCVWCAEEDGWENRRGGRGRGEVEDEIGVSWEGEGTKREMDGAGAAGIVAMDTANNA